MPKLLMIMLCALISFDVYSGTLPAPKVVQLNERVYALLGPEELPNKTNRGYMVNSVLVVGDTGAVIIDTGFTHEIGRHLRRAASKITAKPITHIINTHAHGDHYLGNSAFPRATIISSEKARETINKEGYEARALVERMTGAKFPDTHPIPATQVYAEKTKTTITLNGVKFMLWVPETSHTPGDLLVYLPDDAVLVGGDVLVNGSLPNFREGVVRNWINTLTEITTLPFKTAVPGHGPLMTRADIEKFHARIATLYTQIELGYKAGMSDSEIRQQMDLSEWQKLKRFDEMGANINRVYLEVEAANF